jgi:hypothetical protein
VNFLENITTQRPFEFQLKMHRVSHPFATSAHPTDAGILWLFKMNFSEIMLADEVLNMAPLAEWPVTGTPVWTRRTNNPGKTQNARCVAGQDKRSATKISREQIP